MTDITENCPKCGGTLLITAITWDGDIEQMCNDCHEIVIEEREL